MQHIKELREKRGLTQAAAAEMLGIDRKTWIEWEKGEEGKRGPGVQDLRRLASLLGCSSDYLLGVVDLPPDLVPVLSDLQKNPEFIKLLRQIRAASSAYTDFLSVFCNQDNFYNMSGDDNAKMNNNLIYIKGGVKIAGDTLEKLIDTYSAQKAQEAANAGRVEEDRRQQSGSSTGRKRR